jgi:hypothetical protein
MTTRRGRHSKAVREMNLRQDATKIAEHFRRYPLRQRVDPQFGPYYQRVLNGDPAAVLDYFERYDTLDPAYYEMLGRLVLLGLRSARHIISEIQGRGNYFEYQPGPFRELPDYVINGFKYREKYDWLKPLCDAARQFIRQEYKANPSVRRKELWDGYVTGFYRQSTAEQNAPARSEAIDKLKASGETVIPHIQHNPRQSNELLCDLVDRFSVHNLLPRPIFFELAETNRRADARAERDKRYGNRRFVQTPSSIARKYACAMVGISPSSVTH